MSKPRILSTSVLAESRLFRIEALNLAFSNGQQETFECLRAQGDGVVMVAAINPEGQLLMVREYAAGTDSWELGFVKGKIDPGESAAEAAARELIEEVGFAAGQLDYLRAVTTSPGYSNFLTHLFIARDLTPAFAAGDEVEPLQQVIWEQADIDALYDHAEVTDARVLFLLSLLQRP